MKVVSEVDMDAEENDAVWVDLPEKQHTRMLI